MEHKTTIMRYINIARVLLVALIVLFIAMGIQTSEAFSFKSMTLKFAQISDAHISSNPDTSYKVLSDSKDLLKDAIQQVNTVQNLDFVMFTGDMVNNPTKENYRDFFSLLSELKVPSLTVFGNHDYAAADSTLGLSKNEVLEIIKKHNLNYVFNESYYAFSPKKDYRIIALDLSIDDKTTSNGRISNEQLQFLEKELTTHSDKVIVIFQHFPVIEPFHSSHHQVLNADEYLNILEKSKNPILVLSGHYHTTKIVKKDNIIHISSPSLVTYPNAFRIIDITNYDDRAVFNFHFNETGLSEVQQKSQTLTMTPSTLLGKEEYRIATFIIKKKIKKAKAKPEDRLETQEVEAE